MIFLRVLSSLKHRIPTYLSAFWAIPAALLIRCLRPWITIRICTLRSDRIGHFAADSALIWADQQSRMALLQPTVTFCSFNRSGASNLFLASMVRRNLKYTSLAAIIETYSKKMPGHSRHMPLADSSSRDVSGLLEGQSMPMAFSAEEDTNAYKWLLSHGWNEGDPFVCLQVRDDAYLGNDVMHLCKDWSYHSYRNSDIHAYANAALWLANQGVWVLRMGKIAAIPIPCNHPRIIDYASDPSRSDFLDVWLFAHCHLCISTGSGPDAISDVYRKPLLLMNFLPLSHCISWSFAFHHFKRLTWRHSGEKLTLSEYLDNNFLRTSQYDDAGIEIIDHDPSYILLGVQEMWKSINGQLHEDRDDQARQQAFWSIVRSHPKARTLHGFIHPKARASPLWLRYMGDKFLR